MSDFPLVGNGSVDIEDGFTLATTVGTTITSNSTANTVGSWVELISAANNVHDTVAIEIVISNTGAANTQFLVDIAVGGSGVEEVLLPQLLAYTSTGSHEAMITYKFPIEISSGTRISARCQSNGSSQSTTLHMNRTTGSFSSEGPGSYKVTAYGVNTADSGAVQVARTTAGTYGAFVEIISATTAPIKGFVVGASRNPSSWSSSRLNYEVAVGASSSEEVIAGGRMITTSNNETGSGFASPFIGVAIAEGERISIHAAGAIANSDLDFDYAVYGVS